MSFPTEKCWQYSDAVFVKQGKAIPAQASGGPYGFQEVEAHGFQDNQPYAPAVFTSQELFLVLFLLEAELTSWP
jgi:hypothetical protein